MGKKKVLLILELLDVPTRREVLLSVLYQSLYLLGCYLYYLTLEGGDVDFLKEKAAYFAVLSVLNLLITIIVTLSIQHTFKHKLRLKILNWMLGVTFLSLTLTYDLGTDLEHHGQYNLMLYILMWLPLAVMFMLCKLITTAKKCCANDRFFLYVKASLELATEDWGNGLGGNALQNNWDKCGIYPVGAPWPAVLPHRTLNFFSNIYTVGSNECPNLTHFSKLRNGVLKINCNQDAVIVENPDFISMRHDMFVLTETGMELWANRTQEMVKKYTVPGNAVVKVDAEWFQVFCENKEDYYVQNVKKPEVIDRLKDQSKHRNVEPMNLIVIMMDTVSRAQVFRKMDSLTSTLEYLNNTDSFEVFQFFRMISNGFNTEFNTRAMYTGSQLRRERAGRPYWDIMKGQGNVSLYINGFCEDWMSTFLKKIYEGLDHTVFFPWCHFEYHPLFKTFGNFGGPFSILRRCINGKHVHKHVFDYVRQYWSNYNEFGKVVHIPFQEGHEGTGEVIRTLDPDLASFIRELEASGELDKTVIVLTSDHGSHMGPYFMASEMGELEQKLPLLFMIYPKWFLDKYPEFRLNLRNNEQRLVAHYDTHWTLRHLATLPEFGGEILENRARDNNQHTEIWDCEKNLHFMEVLYTFKAKQFKKNFQNSTHRELYNRIETCFKRLDYTPHELQNVSSVPFTEIKDQNSDENVSTQFYVTDVILNIAAKHWFQDTIQDRTNKKALNVWESDPNDNEVDHNLQAEDQAWDTLQAPGRGRYVFGRSLLKYSNDRECAESGIAKCICNTKSKSSLRANDP